MTTFETNGTVRSIELSDSSVHRMSRNTSALTILLRLGCNKNRLIGIELKSSRVASHYQGLCQVSPFFHEVAHAEICVGPYVAYIYLHAIELRIAEE